MSTATPTSSPVPTNPQPTAGVATRSADDELRARTHAAALGVEMRSPLARIELAASLLAREALTPTGRAHAEQIFDAVVQIDELVERSLRVLVPRVPRAEEAKSLVPVLRDLRARFEPALSACDVRWVADAGGEAEVFGDAELFRAQTCELLRFVLLICEGGGRIETALRTLLKGDAAFRLSIVRNEALESPRFESVCGQFESVRARMLEAGAHVNGQLGSRSSHVELVLPSTAPAADELHRRDGDADA